jgi:hypothetical protein
MCVEDLLYEMEKNGGRPWIAVVHEHMESLFKDKEKEKYQKSKQISKIATCNHKFIDSNHCLKCGWRPD